MYLYIYIYIYYIYICVWRNWYSLIFLQEKNVKTSTLSCQAETVPTMAAKQCTAAVHGETHGFGFLWACSSSFLYTTRCKAFCWQFAKRFSLSRQIHQVCLCLTLSGTCKRCLFQTPSQHSSLRGIGHVLPAPNAKCGTGPREPTSQMLQGFQLVLNFWNGSKQWSAKNTVEYKPIFLHCFQPAILFEFHFNAWNWQRNTFHGRNIRILLLFAQHLGKLQLEEPLHTNFGSKLVWSARHHQMEKCLVKTFVSLAVVPYHWYSPTAKKTHGRVHQMSSLKTETQQHLTIETLACRT